MSGELFGQDYSSGYPDSWNICFIDKSGCAWCGISPVEGRILVDTNGFKKPNQYGKDRFVFSFIDKDKKVIGTPVTIYPWKDNVGNVCSHNKCETEKNYYGTSWLYGNN